MGMCLPQPGLYFPGCWHHSDKLSLCNVKRTSGNTRFTYQSFSNGSGEMTSPNTSSQRQFGLCGCLQSDFGAQRSETLRLARLKLHAHPWIQRWGDHLIMHGRTVVSQRKIRCLLGNSNRLPHILACWFSQS